MPRSNNAKTITVDLKRLVLTDDFETPELIIGEGKGAGDQVTVGFMIKRALVTALEGEKFDFEVQFIRGLLAREITQAMNGNGKFTPSEDDRKLCIERVKAVYGQSPIWILQLMEALDGIEPPIVADAKGEVPKSCREAANGETDLEIAA